MQVAKPKALMINPNANHTDVYDRADIIPFDKITGFFKKNLSIRGVYMQEW